MAESVSTGGTKTFVYKKGHNPILNKEQRSEIKEAYAKADERKAREKRKRRNLTITIILLILIAIILTITFK